MFLYFFRWPGLSPLPWLFLYCFRWPGLSPLHWLFLYCFRWPGLSPLHWLFLYCFRGPAWLVSFALNVPILFQMAWLVSVALTLMYVIKAQGQQQSSICTTMAYRSLSTELQNEHQCMILERLQSDFQEESQQLKTQYENLYKWVLQTFYSYKSITNQTSKLIRLQLK